MDDSREAGGSSPRWRGRLDPVSLAGGLPGLIPALAGTTPDLGPGRDASQGSSPRWRGRLASRLLGRLTARLIPALAGTTRRATRSGSGSRAHPRAGGDDVSQSGGLHGDRGSSPRWRGRRGDECGNDARAGLIPALAGTTRAPASTSIRRRAHPRAGGDDGNELNGELAVVWLIPALAGTTTCGGRARRGGGAHPRAGGDDARVIAEFGQASGSSPRWRGRPAGDHDSGVTVGLIPALAGTTCRSPAASTCPPAHPRAGGDDSAWKQLRHPAAGSSPRWRGRPTHPESRERKDESAAHPRAGGDDAMGNGTTAV